jgi:hypothetical protein
VGVGIVETVAVCLDERHCGRDWEFSGMGLIQDDKV